MRKLICILLVSSLASCTSFKAPQRTEYYVDGKKLSDDIAQSVEKQERVIGFELVGAVIFTGVLIIVSEASKKEKK